MPVREKVKALLANEGITLKEMTQCMTQKTGRKYSLSGLSQRMGAGTLSFNEVEIIAEILGYSVEFKKN